MFKDDVRWGRIIEDLVAVDFLTNNTNTLNVFAVENRDEESPNFNFEAHEYTEEGELVSKSLSVDFE